MKPKLQELSITYGYFQADPWQRRRAGTRLPDASLSQPKQRCESQGNFPQGTFFCPLIANTAEWFFFLLVQKPLVSICTTGTMRAGCFGGEQGGEGAARRSDGDFAEAVLEVRPEHGTEGTSLELLFQTKMEPRECKLWT